MKLNNRTIHRNNNKPRDSNKKHELYIENKENHHKNNGNKNNIICSFKLTPNNRINEHTNANRDKIVIANSSTEIGDVRSVKRKKVKKVYLPEHNEQGVGSFYLMTHNRIYRSSNKRYAKVFECETGSKEHVKKSNLKNNILYSSKYSDYNDRINRNMKYNEITPDLNNRNKTFTKYHKEQYKNELITNPIKKTASISSSLTKRYELLINSSNVNIENVVKNVPLMSSESNHKQEENIDQCEINNENLIKPSLADDKELKCFKEGVQGMFKLWNDKYNFESDDMKRNSNGENKDNVKSDKTSAKSRRKRFLWFKTKKKNKISKTYIAGRCQINNGFRLQLEPYNDTHFNFDKDKLNFNSWIKIYQSKSIQSKEKVRVRWNNELFSKSNSTIIKLFDALYNNKGFRSSQSEILSNTYKSSYLQLKQQMPNKNHNIEAYVLQKTVLDKAIIKNTNANSTNEINYLTKKEFVEKSKAFSKKLDTIFQTENLRLSRLKSSSDCLKMRIPRRFLFAPNDEDHISKEAVKKIIDYDTDDSLDINTDDSEMKCFDKNAIRIGNNIYIKIRNNLVKVSPLKEIHKFCTLNNQSAELRRIENRSKLAETYIQDYFKNSLAVNSCTPSGSESSIKNEIMSWSSDDNKLLYSNSSCNVFHSEGKSKQGHTNLFKKFKYWTVSRTSESKEAKGTEFTRTLPKDSLEVHKRRKIYALSKQVNCVNNSSSCLNVVKNESQYTNKCRKSNLKRKGISFNEPSPEKAFSGILRQSSMKSVKCASSESSKGSCNKSAERLKLESCTSAQKSILKLSDKKSSTKCEKLTKDSCNGSDEINPNLPCNVCPKEIIKIKDKIYKESNHKCDATTCTKETKKSMDPCYSNQESGEHLCTYPGPLKSNISDPECVKKLIKSFNPATPTCPPKCPLASLSDEFEHPKIEIIRRKSICPTPKCSKEWCKKSDCNLDTVKEKSKCNAECSKNSNCNLNKELHEHSNCKAECCKNKNFNLNKESHLKCKAECCKKSNKDLDKFPQNLSQCTPELCKKSNCSLHKLPNTLFNCNQESCKANSKPSLPFTPGVAPEQQRQARKEFYHKELGSNESVLKTENNFNKNVDAICSCSSKTNEKPTSKSKTHVCKGCQNPIKNINTNSCCTNCPSAQTKVVPEKPSGHPGFKLQVIPSKHKSNNNAFVLNSMEKSCNPEEQDPLNVNSMEIKTSMLDGSDMPLLKERELSVLHDVYTSQTKINECKTNLSKIISSSHYGSKSSVSDLVEIKFKLKIKKGDRNTEVKVENHNVKDKLNKKHIHKNVSSKIDKKDVYLMQSMKNDTDILEGVDNSAINNDVNITITVRNNNTHRANYTRKKVKDRDEVNNLGKHINKSDNESTTTNDSDFLKLGKDSSFKTSYTNQTVFTEHKLSTVNTSKMSEESKSISESNSTKSSTSNIKTQNAFSNKALNINNNEYTNLEEYNTEISSVSSSRDNNNSKIKYELNKLQHSKTLYKIVDNNFSIDTKEKYNERLSKRNKKDKLKELMEITKTLEHNEINVRMVAEALKPIFTPTCSCESSRADYKEFLNKHNKNNCCCKSESNDDDNTMDKPEMCNCNVLKNLRRKTTNDAHGGCCCGKENKIEDSSIDIGKVRILKNTGKQQSYRLYDEPNKKHDDDEKRHIINKSKINNIKIKDLEKTDNVNTINMENKIKNAKFDSLEIKHNILQSEEIKKAVLSIYAENTPSNNNCIVNLPKWIGCKNILGNLFYNVSGKSSSESL